MQVHETIQVNKETTKQDQIIDQHVCIDIQYCDIFIQMSLTHNGDYDKTPDFGPSHNKYQCYNTM